MIELLESTTKAEWLEQRRDFITATDMAYLYTSPARWAQIRAEKDGNGTEFRVSPEMEWGTNREAALVAFAQTVDSSIVPNNQVAVHLDEPHAATPDGIGDDVVCEVKTGSKSGLADARRRHMVQMQWQMWVTGTSRCLYVTEVRDWDEMGFSPGERTHEWVDRDEDMITELVDVADRFLSIEVTDLDVLIAAVVDVKAERDKVAERLTEAEGALRAHIGDRDFSHDGPFGRVSLTLPMKVNVDKLRTENPDIVDEFSTQSLDMKRLQAERPDLVSAYREAPEQGKRTLRVTETPNG